MTTCKQIIVAPFGIRLIAFYVGKTLNDELANYNALYTDADGSAGEYRRETTPVEHFGIANAFGLSDMHGNVWKWCQDY